MICAEQLKVIAPGCGNPEAWSEALNTAMLTYGIADSDEDMAEFLAQCAHESQQFMRLEENLRYTPDRLMVVWPKKFPTLEIATKHANSPHSLADYVYAGRFGNGDEASGDGWKFRGRGVIGVTFKDNYKALGLKLGLPLLECPDMLQTIPNAANSAALFWKSHGLNALASDGDFLSVTRAVNGGTNGLTERQKYLARTRAALGIAKGA